MGKTVYGALVWFVATLFVVYAFCLNTAAAVFSTAIKTSLHASSIGASIAVGTFIVGFACMQIPAGYLLDRYNPRYIVSFGVFLLALGNILISYANNLVLFSLSNLLQGIGGSFAFIAAGVLIGQWFAPKLFPVMFGLTQTISCILAGIIHYVFFHALTVFSWNTLYQYLSVFGFALFILTLLIVKTPDGYKEKNIKGNQVLSLGKSLSMVLGNSQLWLCAISASFSFGALMAYGGFWYTNIQSFYSASTNDSLIIGGLLFAGIGVGTPILGWISNVFKSRVLIIHATLVLGAMTLLLGIYLPHFNINTSIISKIISFLIGFLLSGSMLFYTIVSEICADNVRGVALSVTNTGVFLFNTFLLFLPYFFVTQSSTSFFTHLWIMPFSVMVGILLVYFVKDSYSKQQ